MIAIVLSLVITAVTVWLMYIAFVDSADTPQTTYQAMSDNAQLAQDVYTIIFILAGAVMAGVIALTLAFSFIYRERPGQQALQIHGNSKLELLWTLLPVLIVAAMAVPTFNAIAVITGDAPEDSLEVKAVGYQWWFQFQYPELGVVTASDLHLPVDRPILVKLESKDVIHSFWVPQLSGKVDMVPGHTNQLWFTPNTVGEFMGQCAEFCGLSHANMRFRVFVHTQEDFDAWVQSQLAEAATPEEGLAAAGAQQFTMSGCIGCHTVRGNALAMGVIGPELTHFGSRTRLAGGMVENTEVELRRWLKNPPAMKPGSIMPNLNLTDEQIDSLVAYLYSLQ
ncbi:MAG: cytochrome c oxidase subunit II [Chloroflexi bacterium]|nr:cytochrome c oxidase subunit II [Chloroflexota bacterium]MDA1240059.1 cytochrome c oxidase subunit II [Chloroflexota bacterium]MQC25582.1 cytochrome c oxidase subunit II [Chloroflexota bacterium]MQC48127.1 cytochrome c oxidase subunit II [Chloroflexota bacterium]